MKKHKNLRPYKIRKFQYNVQKDNNHRGYKRLITKRRFQKVYETFLKFLR
jgi:hypothetical protein